MEEKFDQVKYKNQFTREKYDRISLCIPKGQKELIKEKAAANGESINEYIQKAIKLRMEEQ